MKRKFFKSRNMERILLLTVVISSLLFTACSKQKDTPEQKDPVVEAESDTQLLLSFDSYKEITTAGLKIGNQFGETKINKDKDYITEGEGSWLVKPQGNYAKQGQYPYFRMRCTESSFAKSDFNAYDKILLDVYNASDEEVQIEICLSVTNNFDSYDSGEKVICTLQPNAWTTCEYGLSGEEYSAALDLTEVRYMNVTFLTQKDGKDDTVPALYLDNLRGHLAEEERIRTEFDVNFDNIVSFENVMERYLFLPNTIGSNKLVLSRVAYENCNVEPYDTSFGKYALQGDVEGATWPAFTINYNKEETAGSIVSFMLYVAADESIYGDSTFNVEAPKCIMNSGRLKFNQWVNVEFELSNAAESTWMFLNFDNGEGSSMFGSTPVTFYMDNFQILSKPEVDFTKGVTFEDPLQRLVFRGVSLVEYANSSIGKQGSTYGTYGMTRDLTGMTWPSFNVDFGKTYKKGDRLSFMVYVEADKNVSANQFYYMGSWDVDIMNGKLEFNKWQQIDVVFKKDVSSANIFANFDDGKEKNKLGKTPLTLYLDNFYIVEMANVKKNNDFAKGITFEDIKTAAQYLFTYTELIEYEGTSIGKQSSKFGTYGLKRDATGITWPQFWVNFDKEYSEGDILTFMLYVEADESLSKGRNYYVGSYGHDVSDDKKEFNQWVEVKVPLKKTAESIGMFLNFDDGNQKPMFGTAAVTAYMDNFRIIDQEDVKKNNDFSEGITFEDPEAASQYLFTYMGLIEYEGTSIGKQSSKFGTYGLKRDATGITWPQFWVNFDKEYSEGDILTFMLYVEADESLAEGRNYYVGAYGHGVSNDKKTFNQWVEVQVPLKKAAERIGMFLNFDDGNEKPMFGDAAVTAYMDNFRIINPEDLKKNNDFAQGITFEDSDAAAQYLFTYTELIEYEGTSIGKQSSKFGTYGLKRDATGITWPQFWIGFNKEYSEGDILTFMLYVEADESLSKGRNYYVGAYGHDVSNAKKAFNQWVEVQVPLKKAAESIGMFLNFDDGNEKPMFGDAAVTAYMDNFKIVTPAEIDSEITFEGITFTGSTKTDYKLTLSTVRYSDTDLTNVDASHGEYALMGNVEAGVRWPAFKANCNAEDLIGKTLKFRVYIDTHGVEPGRKSCTVWSKSGDSLDGTVSNIVAPGYAWYNEWTDIEITIKSNNQPWFIIKSNDSSIYLEHDITIYMDNFSIVTPVDFDEGVTFESDSERNLKEFANKTSGNFRSSLSVMKYSDTNLEVQDLELGEYTMAMDATSVRWPAFQVLCNTEGLTGKTLSFMMYIEGDDAKDANGNTKTSAAVASYSDIDYKGTSNTVLTGNAEFNKWVNVKITINSDLQPWVYLNFNSGSTGISIFGDTKVTVYFDNFQISDGPDFGRGITFESLLERELSLFEAKSSGNFRSTLSTVKYADSTIGVQNEEFGEYALVMDVTGVRWPSFKVLCDTNKLKGKIVSFKMYIEGDESVAKDGNGNPKTSIALASYPNIDYQGTANTVLSGMAGFNKWVEVLIEMKSDSQPWIYLNLNSGSTATSIFGNTPVKVYIDNIKVSE